jgi:hypothetical protein
MSRRSSISAYRESCEKYYHRGKNKIGELIAMDNSLDHPESGHHEQVFYKGRFPIRPLRHIVIVIVTGGVKRPTNAPSDAASLE